MLKRKSINDEKYMEYIEIVEERSQNLKFFLDEFFELSVLESSEHKLNLQSLNVNNILCEEIASFYEEFQKYNIEPQIEILNENFKIIGDAGYLRRSIDNLITNMIKYSKGNEKIKLYKEKNKIIIEFNNKSQNLNEKDLNLIFEKFYTKDISRNLNIKNTGLGLTITKKLIEKMNGNIHATLSKDILSISLEFNER